jgi:excisionase family DNA binding protein
MIGANQAGGQIRLFDENRNRCTLNQTGGAMNRKRSVKITVENNLLIVRHSSRALVCCPECPAQIQMITPEEAATLVGVSTRTIYRWVEVEHPHFTETPEGRLLVCPNSLPLSISKELL